MLLTPNSGSTIWMLLLNEDQPICVNQAFSFVSSVLLIILTLKCPLHWHCPKQLCEAERFSYCANSESSVIQVRRKAGKRDRCHQEGGKDGESAERTAAGQCDRLHHTVVSLNVITWRIWEDNPLKLDQSKSKLNVGFCLHKQKKFISAIFYMRAACNPVRI